MNYSDYTVGISNEPSYYGRSCSAFDAERIAENLAAMIHAQFPGIDTRSHHGKTNGPDETVIGEINEWIENNWMAAL